MNKIEIEFDSNDVADNYRFANTILWELKLRGFSAPANNKSRNPLEIVANHILYNLEINVCQVIHYGGGNGIMSFLKR